MVKVELVDNYIKEMDIASSEELSSPSSDILQSESDSDYCLDSPEQTVKRFKDNEF